MRVVAGSAGGLRLVAPAGTDTRPTGDRVREAVFNSLGSMGVIGDAVVLDLFAGSGALGIEALSRGARRAVFVERNAAARRAIQANLVTTGLGDRASVVAGDALTFLSTRTEPVDLALVDPPYGFDGWAELLDALRAEVAVLESDRAIEVPERWALVRRKRYGSTVITFVRTQERS